MWWSITKEAGRWDKNDLKKRIVYSVTVSNNWGLSECIKIFVADDILVLYYNYCLLLILFTVVTAKEEIVLKI